MITTAIQWYTPEEKKPLDGEVLIMCVFLNTPNYFTSVSVKDGHFNCSEDNFNNEIFVDYWAEIPALGKFENL